MVFPMKRELKLCWFAERIKEVYALMKREL
jgi:hypothetical protein